MRTQKQRARRAALAALNASCFLSILPATGETLRAVVVDAGGEPVRDAVVQALPLDGTAADPPVSAPVEIDQVDKEYVPYVTAVRVGTRVTFPNRDQIRHHVYSFSEAKTFEIPLYEGTPAEPVVFDQRGEVVLGCNIHDWMRAYVFVSETPFFAVTGDAGTAVLELPAGAYSVRVWHPELAGEPAANAQRVVARATGESALRIAIERKRVWQPRRAPSQGDPGYR